MVAEIPSTQPSVATDNRLRHVSHVNDAPAELLVRRTGRRCALHPLISHLPLDESRQTGGRISAAATLTRTGMHRSYLTTDDIARGDEIRESAKGGT